MPTSDQPATNGNGNGNGDSGEPDAAATPAAAATAATGDDAPFEAEHVAATMMRQLTDLLADWERLALALAERGVDPRPLLGQVAGNLRSVADQLDGGAGRPPSG
jgi:hypothetical protein